MFDDRSDDLVLIRVRVQDAVQGEIIGLRARTRERDLGPVRPEESGHGLPAFGHDLLGLTADRVEG